MRLNFELIEFKIGGWGEGEKKVHTNSYLHLVSVYIKIDLL